MKTSKRLKIAFIFAVTLSSVALSTTSNAAVLDFVENQDIGLVNAHAISPNGKFIFSTTIAPKFLTVHKRDQNTGAILEQVQKLEAKDFNSGVEDPSFFPGSMVVSPDSKQLYIAASFDGTEGFNPSILRFDISESGTLTYINSIIVSGRSDGLTMSPSGKLMFVGDGINKNNLASIKRASNGNITTVKKHIPNPIPTSGYNSGGTGIFSVSPDEKSLYASSTDFDGHLFVYSINQDGSLTFIQSFISEDVSTDYHVPGDIVGKGSGGSGSAVSQDGKYVYTAGGYGGAQDSITIFERNNDGTLNFLKNVKAPSLANSDTQPIIGSSGVELVMSNNQKYIYAFDGNYAGFIGVWERNQSSGDLSFIGLVKGKGLRDGTGETMELAKDGSTLNINVGKGISVYDLRADLSLVKSDSVDPVSASGTIDYTLAVSNDKGADAHNVVITDTLPAGTSFISGSVNSNTGACSASGSTVTCTMGKVLSGDGYSAVIKVKAPASQGQITNTASVKSDQLDTNMANNTDTETTNIGSGGTTPTTPTTPSDDGESGGGSMPFEFALLLLLPALLRRRKTI